LGFSVKPARTSRRSRKKARGYDLPVHSLQSLIDDLATVTRNTMAMADSPKTTFTLYPEITPVQERAFRLLGVPSRM
jgi:hypothetical protein